MLNSMITWGTKVDVCLHDVPKITLTFMTLPKNSQFWATPCVLLQGPVMNVLHFNLSRSLT